jgi:hypothetical protein
MCGQLLAGLLGPATNWRVPYLMVAVPSLLLALAIVLLVRDPPRYVPGLGLGNRFRGSQGWLADRLTPAAEAVHRRRLPHRLLCPQSVRLANC